MIEETYERWSPLPDIPQTLNLAGFRHTDDGVKVDLQVSVGEGTIFTLVFESPVAYRNINESYRLRTWNMLGRRALPSLLRVENSQWIAWLRREAGGVLDRADVRHYAIFTDEYCVEFATEFPPSAYRSDRP